ncbi:MAG TPA: hypothetical protein VFK49_07050, partial [Stellaceae bacterium]|nr:hypothetical protein [Stellaceae bacterium]
MLRHNGSGHQSAAKWRNPAPRRFASEALGALAELRRSLTRIGYSLRWPNRFTEHRSRRRKDIAMAPPKLFAEKGALGSGDAKAALAIVRNVVAALVHSGAVKR